ncbi:hypothetical protein HIM_06957 [Hirsutella minnesotensis 3608]|uniref:Cell cycle inhibitor Nif1 n=1 Tax=Hirsutella minnesotensis 3608 TaxID=1043627 RepID=A0A0F8A4I2_9HYPO|nr:hypothetical protein HIM_06957 [Hirsutella minnesotensis 3608]
MQNRPSVLDLRANSSYSTASSSSRPLRSPRLHIAGEAPPELSPLDAFALQSRLLAKQLQDSNKDGNRVSRLPPLTDESPLVQQARSDYFRSFAHDGPSETGPSEPVSTGLGMRTEVEEAFLPQDRPKSMHPRMSRIPPTPEDANSMPLLTADTERSLRGRQLESVSETSDYFGARRERSPSPLHSDTQSQYEVPNDKSPARRNISLLHPAARSYSSAANSADKSKHGSIDELGLVPPRGALSKRSPSTVSSPLPGDDETYSTVSSSVYSPSLRKLSTASIGMANILPSPAVSTFQRSPSIASDSSALPRPSFNFSRPISRAGTPNLDLPIRQASSDSQPSFILADDSAHTPVSMHSEAFPDNPLDDSKSAAPSYIYSTFSLPRGKSVQRSGTPDSQLQGSLKWEQSGLSSSAGSQAPLGAPPSPPTRPSSSSAKPILDDAASVGSSAGRPSTDANKSSIDNARLGVTGYAASSVGRPSVDTTRLSEDAPRGRTLTSPAHDAAARGKTPASVGTSNSASTIRPSQSSRMIAPSKSEMTAEEHLAKGIECHENGSLNESTYHLRHAARQNNPTAMLLYALACRHGWGMRANQREGVQWLRKAAEYASVEIADDEDRAKEGRPANFLESKTRKAQFALSIYELGVSHMNGWGIEQDKSLALRCFEIAGSWGDVDALAEAGFCYAKGVGCKKDLKKSAKFYRMAEAKGMSMVGNSWIHKSKYNDSGKDASPKEKGKKKARSKSRTRAIFGLKSG